MNHIWLGCVMRGTGVGPGGVGGEVEGGEGGGEEVAEGCGREILRVVVGSECLVVTLAPLVFHTFQHSPFRRPSC